MIRESESFCGVERSLAAPGTYARVGSCISRIGIRDRNISSLGREMNSPAKYNRSRNRVVWRMVPSGGSFTLWCRSNPCTWRFIHCAFWRHWA